MLHHGTLPHGLKAVHIAQLLKNHRVTIGYGVRAEHSLACMLASRACVWLLRVLH
jgi:hypothetical protein